MLSLCDLEYTIGERTLFRNVTVNINPRDRFGLVGPNGAGKTTFIKIITGEVSPSSGTVSRPAALRLGYLPQEEIVAPDNTLLEEVLRDYHRQLVTIRRLEEKIAAAPHDTGTLQEYGQAQERFAAMGSYEYEADGRKVLAGLGFEPEQLAMRMRELSGGWQMRAILARILLNKPDLLLLDEPTNHLDIESIEWLENYLQNFKGAMLVVSHDRFFLDKILKTAEGTTGIWEIDFGNFTRYRADYAGYLHESAVNKQRLVHRAKNQQKEIAELKDFIARNKANKKKAGVVKSREKYLERMEIIEVETERKKIRVDFPVEPIHSPMVVRLVNVGKAYRGREVFKNISLVVKNGDKIALIGKNGAGKSTLCRIIAGREEPTGGTRTASDRLKIGEFSHEIMLKLDPRRTVLDEALENAPIEIHSAIRSFLGVFLFSGDDALKKVGVLSGGEKTRLAMLKTMLKPSNILILDEPTYHLDQDSIASIKQAVISYRGTIVFVTHERDLIAAFASRILELRNGHLKDYPGDFSYYLWKRNHPAPEAVSRQAGTNVETRGKKVGKQMPLAEKIKRQIMTKEERRHKLRNTFSRPGFIADTRKSQKFFEEYERLTTEIEELEKQLAAEQNDVPVKQ